MILATSRFSKSARNLEMSCSSESCPSRKFPPRARISRLELVSRHRLPHLARMIVRQGDGFVHLDHFVRLAVHQQLALIYQERAIAIRLNIADTMRDEQDSLLGGTESLQPFEALLLEA